jgi:hypothetical protein
MQSESGRVDASHLMSSDCVSAVCVSTSELQSAIESIDAANREDPNEFDSNISEAGLGP